MTLMLKQILVLLYFASEIYGRILRNNTENYENVGKTTGRMILHDIECPAINSRFPVYLPHPSDCSKFYTCDNGSPSLTDCYPGLHFSTKIMTCDYPEYAGCVTEVSITPEGRKIVDNDDDTGICPAEKSELPAYVPHPSDCSKFYICDEGYSELKECQPGLHFSPKIKTCDYPENAGCDTDYKTKIDNRMVDDTNECSVQNTDLRNRPSFVPDPTDCTRFFICNRGKKVSFVCPSNLHFNPKNEACDFPEEAGCVKNKVVAKAGVPSPFCPSRNGKIPIYYRHPTNCSVFYMCANGLAYEFVCPAKLHFNVRRKICDYENNSGCRSPYA